MAGVQESLQAQDDFVREILAISASPALSVGVLHRGEIIHTAHYGTREVGKQLEPNDDTMYRVASLTKVLTASAIAALVVDGKLEWDRPIREYLPEFSERDDEVGTSATMRDLLSNRTGLANGDFYWGQQHQEFLLPHDQLVRMAAHLPAVKPFRKRFVYSGWNYGLATEVVEAVVETTLGKFMQERFLEPLGMKRTTITNTDGWDNLALGYGVDADGTLEKIPFPQMDDGIGLAGAYGGKSSVKDILLMYQSLLSAQQDQIQSGLSKSPHSPFIYTRDIFEPHIPVIGSTSYCMGLYKTVLPGPLGIGSLNAVSWLPPKDVPIMGAAQKGLEVWHHSGSMPVCSTTALLVPKTQTAVVVLSNTIGFMDPSDFIAQQLLAVLIGDPLNTRLLDVAKAARTANLNQYPKLYAKLAKGRTGNINRPVQFYEGYYWNAAGNFCLVILAKSKSHLKMNIQDVPLTGYDLEPYDGDVWWWPPNRTIERCEKGMHAFQHPLVHLVTFESSKGGHIDRLVWHHDHSAKAETFFRGEKRPQWKGYPSPRPRL